MEVWARVLDPARLRPGPQVREVVTLGLELGPETVALQGHRGALTAPAEVVTDSYRNLDGVAALSARPITRVTRKRLKRGPRLRHIVAYTANAELALQKCRPAEKTRDADCLTRLDVEEPDQIVERAPNRVCGGGSGSSDLSALPGEGSTEFFTLLSIFRIFATFRALCTAAVLAAPHEPREKALEDEDAHAHVVPGPALDRQPAQRLGNQLGHAREPQTLRLEPETPNHVPLDRTLRVEHH